MKLVNDFFAGMSYVTVLDDAAVHQTREIDDQVVIDFDIHGRVVGIELFGTVNAVSSVTGPGVQAGDL